MSFGSRLNSTHSNRNGHFSYLITEKLSWTGLNSIDSTEKFVLDLGANRLSANIIYDNAMPAYDFNMIVAKLDESISDITENIFDEAIDDFRNAKKDLMPFTIDTPCSAGRGECSIDHAGYLYPCRLMTMPEMRCGNLVEQKFKEVWEESEVLRKIRGFDHRLIEPCSSCSFFRLCRGGCRAMALRLTGDIHGYPGDTYCANKKRVLFNRIVNHTKNQIQERSSND